MMFYVEVTGSNLVNARFGVMPMVKQPDGRWVLAV